MPQPFASWNMIDVKWYKMALQLPPWFPLTWKVMEFQGRPRWQGKLENFLIGQGKVTSHPYCMRNVKVLLQLVACGFCFYHTTLCVSAVFAVAWCPSVCPSVTLVDCIQTAEDIIRLLSQPDSHIILVFCARAPVPIPRGTPSAGAQNMQGWENFEIFN